MLAGATAVLLVCFAATISVPAFADGGRHAAFAIDANTGRVLHAQSADAPRFPASLTKVMTLYLVFELIEAGKLDMNTPIRVSAQAASVPPSKLDLDAGDTIPLGAAIRALVTKSANDVAVAIAEHISGTEAAFARAMTAKAHQLGMRRTTFRNAHGLPDSEQVTTARDMATLALAIYDHFPRHARVFATKRFSYAGNTYRNHNTLLGTFEGMEGIKTGYTRSSGFNLSTSVRRDGRHVVAVVLGGRTAAARNAEMRTLLTRTIARASTTKSRRPVAMPRSEPAVASARPAPRPSPRIAAAPRPAHSAAPAPVAQPAPRLIEAPALVSAPPPATQIASRNEPPIVIARVRPVPIGSQIVSEPAAARAEEFQQPPMYVPPYGDRRQAEPAQSWHAAPAAAPAPPVLREEPREAPRAAQRPAYALPDTGRGAKPSTFAAQAARLEQGAPAVVAGYHGPPPSYVGAMPRAHEAPSPRGDHAVQVGAFATAAEAQERLRAVRQSAGPVLAGAADHTERVSQGARTLYRARFADLDATAATQACNALRRQRVDCFVARLH